MNNELANPYYKLLVEDCKAIVTESVFVSRWALVEGYHLLGERIAMDEQYQIYAKGNQKMLAILAGNIGLGERTLYYAIEFYNKFPVLEDVPEGKNISWTKLVNKYLPEHTEKEEKSNYQNLLKGFAKWKNKISETVSDPLYLNRLNDLLNQVEMLLRQADQSIEISGDTSITVELPDQDIPF